MTISLFLPSAVKNVANLYLTMLATCCPNQQYLHFVFFALEAVRVEASVGKQSRELAPSLLAGLNSSSY